VFEDKGPTIADTVFYISPKKAERSKLNCPSEQGQGKADRSQNS